MKIIGDRWSVLIVMSIMDVKKRFSEIESQVGDISPRALSMRLKALEEAGLIEKESFNEFPPRTEYTATQKAKDLKDAVDGLKDWAKKYC